MCGVNWGTSQGQPWIRLKGEDPLYEYINRRKFLRDSDAVIVSDDPVGQHNPLASQGPLDWRRPGNGPRYLVRKDHRGTSGGRVMAYKSTVVRCRCVSYANGRAACRRRSPWLISSLKPYWGKPAVRNFRGGGGNMPPSPVRPPRRLMDIGLYPASDSVMRLLSTRHAPLISRITHPFGFVPFAAHNAARLAGESPAAGIDCIPV